MNSEFEVARKSEPFAVANRRLGTAQSLPEPSKGMTSACRTHGARVKLNAIAIERRELFRR